MRNKSKRLVFIFHRLGQVSINGDHTKDNSSIPDVYFF
jgi:hypothetical protein